VLAEAHGSFAAAVTSTAVSRQATAAGLYAINGDHGHGMSTGAAAALLRLGSCIAELQQITDIGTEIGDAPEMIAAMGNGQAGIELSGDGEQPIAICGAGRRGDWNRQQAAEPSRTLSRIHCLKLVAS